MPREPHIVLSGLPGRMATLFAERLIREIDDEDDFSLQQQALTGPN